MTSSGNHWFIITTDADNVRVNLTSCVSYWDGGIPHYLNVLFPLFILDHSFVSGEPTRQTHLETHLRGRGTQPSRSAPGDSRQRAWELWSAPTWTPFIGHSSVGRPEHRPRHGLPSPAPHHHPAPAGPFSKWSWIKPAGRETSWREGEESR